MHAHALLLEYSIVGIPTIVGIFHCLCIVLKVQLLSSYLYILYYVYPKLTACFPIITYIINYSDSFIFIDTSDYKYIAVKEKLNHSEAQAYCSKDFKKFSASGDLASFQDKSDLNKIIGLIYTINYTEENAYYWMGCDGTNATFAIGIVTGCPTGKCLVLFGSDLKHLPCSNETYFICKITMNINSQGIVTVTIKVSVIGISYKVSVTISSNLDKRKSK